MDQSRIRNFAIIAHIDHGKTTLVDRLIEIVTAHRSRERTLDTHPIEQERGITIKLAPLTLNYQGHLLNLIDTPGHIDFNYEVERSLAACEGALLLVDATKGIQAQTLANLRLAQTQGLTVIPVVNKIDLPQAQIESTATSLKSLLPTALTLLQVSAKTGANTDQVLGSVIKFLPPPTGRPEAPLRALVFNSSYHPHLGVIAMARVIDGHVSPGTKLKLLQNDQTFTPKELGVFTPGLQPQPQLLTGQVGYIATGLKDIHQVKVGDTITAAAASPPPLPGYRHIRPNVYLEVYPADSNQYRQLLEAVDKIKLLDAALTTSSVNSPALGNGLKVGFLGLLHAEIFAERLKRDFNLNTILTSPSVEYRLTLTDGREITVTRASDYPDPSLVKSILEPVAAVTLLTPEQYLGQLIKILEDSRGTLKDTRYLSPDQVEISYSLPLIEVITHLHDAIKSVSSGFASMDYRPVGYQPVELLKLDVLLNYQEFPALSRLEIKDRAESTARKIAAHLKNTIPSTQFAIPIQVKAGGNILARETIRSLRKDVTAKLYGGDRTRRLKLLAKQKKGKAKLAAFGQVILPPQAFKIPT